MTRRHNQGSIYDTIKDILRRVKLLEVRPAPPGGGGGGALIVQENDVTKEAAATTLDFGTGFDVTSAPAGEANVVLDLSEISAGGELGGTLDAPTVDATHAGSAHHGQAHAINGADHTGTLDDAQIPGGIARDTEVTSAVSTHEGASDPHTGYQKESEKAAASGYASLDAGTLVPSAQLGSGTADATKKLRGDRAWVDDDECITFAQGGALVVGAGPFRHYMKGAWTITQVRASVGTAPTGASVIVDVNKNGTTIFTTQSNRPTIAVSTNTDLADAIDVSALADGDYLTVDIDQIGSTIAGSDLTVQVWMRR